MSPGKRKVPSKHQNSSSLVPGEGYLRGCQKVLSANYRSANTLGFSWHEMSTPTTPLSAGCLERWVMSACPGAFWRLSWPPLAVCWLAVRYWTEELEFQGGLDPTHPGAIWLSGWPPSTVSGFSPSSLLYRPPFFPFLPPQGTDSSISSFFPNSSPGSSNCADGIRCTKKLILVRPRLA